MKHLFRQPHPGLPGYAALMAFAVAYVATLAVVIAPEQVIAALDAPIRWSAK